MYFFKVICNAQLKISCSLCESLRFSFLNKLFDTTEDISSSCIFLVKKMYRAAIDTPLNYSRYYCLILLIVIPI